MSRERPKIISTIPAVPGWFKVDFDWYDGELSLYEQPIIAWVVTETETSLGLNDRTNQYDTCMSISAVPLCNAVYFRSTYSWCPDEYFAIKDPQGIYHSESYVDCTKETLIELLSNDKPKKEVA